MRLSPSKLCHALLATFAVKLCVLGLMLCASLAPGLFPWFSGVEGAGVLKGAGVAHAAETTGAGAPPAPRSIGKELPESVDRPSPGTPGAPGSPGAAPGVSGLQAPQQPVKAEEPTRALPPLSSRPLSAPASANATEGAASGPMDINRELLIRKQDELARKEQQLRTLETEISGKLERLQILENRLRIMIKDAEETKDAKFRHLVDMLSNMKAKQAAEVLEKLEQQTAVRVLAGMRGRQAGEILTYVKPEKAALLTEALARMQLPLD